MTACPAELRTARLLLRQWRDDDVELLAAIYAHPEVERQLVPTDLAQTQGQVERFRSLWREGLPSQWAVEEIATGRLLGRVGLMGLPHWQPAPGAIEVSWTLTPEVWGRGYATEGGRASLDVGFTRLGLGRILSITRPTNLASRRVMEKLGLTHRGESDYKNIPHVWYDVTSDEWSAAGADR